MAMNASPVSNDMLLSQPPSRLVVTLYDETIGALRASIEAIHRKDIEARCNAVSIASELLATLYLCLDHEQGGEVADNLGRLYSFLIPRLQRINIYNDLDTAEEAIRLLQPLRDSWHELDRRIESGGAVSPAA
ncbi:MAG: flagellar export chaperone FliS [Tistlia sp.]|uniref:flagellar export chaperone FliS n=1 Tax=Tistlia sp. TaxID=3057121 RepID=UPI0034A45A54